MKVYTTGQVSRICQVATSTVHKWFDTGKLKGFRVPGSRHRRIPRDNLVEFLQEHGFPTEDIENEDAIRVLLVTRDESLQRGVEQATRDHPAFQMETAKNGFDAGLIAESVSLHCAVVDFSMGASESATICRNLRKCPALMGAAIIVIAPRQGESESIDQSQVDDVFVKPFDPRLLVARILTLVKSRARQ